MNVLYCFLGSLIVVRVILIEGWGAGALVYFSLGMLRYLLMPRDYLEMRIEAGMAEVRKQRGAVIPSRTTQHVIGLIYTVTCWWAA
jgi:hypothetical protein